MGTTPKEFIYILEEKLFDKIPKLRDAEEIEKVRLGLKECLIEIMGVGFRKPSEGLSNKLEQLFDKILSYRKTSGLDFNLDIEICTDKIILNRKKEILLLWKEIENYLESNSQGA